jgi:hypothetical protein
VRAFRDVERSGHAARRFDAKLLRQQRPDERVTIAVVHGARRYSYNVWRR